MNNLVLCQDCLAVKSFTAARHNADEQCKCGGDFCGCDHCQEQAKHTRIPKQVTNAPKLGAAVSSMPLHEVTIPLDKSVTADYMANHARNEWCQAMTLARHNRLDGDSEGAAFFLNDAAEYRRIFMAFRQAINVMGGL
ncbi:hypothetical protein L4D09_19635 [Photobacterium makurazakiensis]|uniref:hypothetical protein n=1 Tax=Photobacterium makurazakiensis TaxID=2910234 RepID=UPI003D0A6EED